LLWKAAGGHGIRKIRETILGLKQLLKKLPGNNSHKFMRDNYSEDYDPDGHIVPDIFSVTRLNEFMFHKLHDDEKTYQGQDEKNLKIYFLNKDHAFRNYDQPERKKNKSKLFFSHRDSCNTRYFNAVRMVFGF
jgi:hypothetical protein